MSSGIAPPQAHPDTGRVGQLDVLRAVACILVLVAHLDTVYGMPELPAETGPVGVAIFFALSGYLITRGLLRRSDAINPPFLERSSKAKFDLTGFYLKRATRILPPYMLLLLVLWPFWRDERLAWCATFTFNFLYVSGARDYFHVQQLSASVPPIGHLWSLCVEEHYYWAWPLILAQFGRNKSRWLLLGTVLATPVVAFWISDAMDARGANPDVVVGILSRITFTQLTSVALGSLVALHEPWMLRPARLLGARVAPVTVLGWLLIALAWVLGWKSVQEQILSLGNENVQYLQALEPTRIHLWGAGIAFVGLAWSGLARLKTWQYVGRISYGLYLYHLPIYAWYGLATFGKSELWLTGVCAVATTFLVASLSFHFFEQPCIHWGQRIAAAPADKRLSYRSVGLVTCLGLLLLCCLILSTKCYTAPLAHLLNFSPKIPVEQRRHSLTPLGTATHAYRWLGVDHCYDTQGFRRSTPIAPRQADTVRIMAIGDSYTWGACVHEHQTYSAVLERELRKTGRRIEVINCGKPGGQAEDAPRTVEEQLLHHHPDVILYAATMTDFLPSGQGWQGHKAEEWYLPENENRFRKAVSDLKAICEGQHIELAAFVFFQNPADSYHAHVASHIESLLRDSKVQTISIATYLKQNADRDYRVRVPFDDHPNQECHRLVAGLLVESARNGEWLLRRPP